MVTPPNTNCPCEPLVSFELRSSRFFLTMLGFGEEGYFSISRHSPFFSCLPWWVPTSLLVAWKEGWITCRSLFSSCLGLTRRLFLWFRVSVGHPLVANLPPALSHALVHWITTTHGAQTLWYRDRHSESYHFPRASEPVSPWLQGTNPALLTLAALCTAHHTPSVFPILVYLSLHLA